ncbi:hypothetical protein [uncultured Nostoc sp.]
MVFIELRSQHRQIMSANFDDTILKYFCNLEDPRIERTKQHQLVDIVALA